MAARTRTTSPPMPTATAAAWFEITREMAITIRMIPTIPLTKDNHFISLTSDSMMPAPARLRVRGLTGSWLCGENAPGHTFEPFLELDLVEKASVSLAAPDGVQKLL